MDELTEFIAFPTDAKRLRLDNFKVEIVTVEPGQSCSTYADEDTTFNYEDYVKEELFSDDEVQLVDDVEEVVWESDEELDPLSTESNNTSNLWTNDPSSIRQFDFVRDQELLVQPAGTEPIDYFTLLFDRSIMDFIIERTNTSAFELHCQEGRTDKSRIAHWKELNFKEFKIFLGLLLHTGTITLNRIQDYWKKDPLFNIQCFVYHMSRNRFWLILRCLNFAASNEVEVEDSLQQVMAIVNHFNQKMSSVFYPGQELMLDEPVVLWRGRLLFHQYIKSERLKSGMKLHMLTNPDGIVVKFAVNAGSLHENRVTQQTQDIVMSLMDGKLDSGHSLHMDQSYNSLFLTRRLSQRQTHCTGVLKAGAPNIPTAVGAAVLKKGDTVTKYKDGIMVGKVRDRTHAYDSLFISNEHADAASAIDAIANYERAMYGVNRQDQMFSYYPCEKMVLRWPIKVFIHILQMSLVNALHLYNIYAGKEKMALYDFRISVIKSLLNNSEARGKETVPNMGENRYQEEHVMRKCAKSRNGTTLRRKCKSCMEKGVKRRETVYECSVCPDNPGYCLDCCRLIHN